MSDSHFEHPPVDRLQAILDSAREFGLSDSDVWQGVNEAALRADDDTTVPEFLDEVCDVMAQRILSRERQSASGRLP